MFLELIVLLRILLFSQQSSLRLTLLVHFFLTLYAIDKVLCLSLTVVICCNIDLFNFVMKRNLLKFVMKIYFFKFVMKRNFLKFVMKRNLFKFVTKINLFKFVTKTNLFKFVTKTNLFKFVMNRIIYYNL